MFRSARKSTDGENKHGWRFVHIPQTKKREGTVRGTHRMLLVVFTNWDAICAGSSGIRAKPHTRFSNQPSESRKRRMPTPSTTWTLLDVIFTQGMKPGVFRHFGEVAASGPRFAPPAPGEYDYHLESTDRNNLT